MILSNFRAWTQVAPPIGRAEAAGALARAYLFSQFDDAKRRDALRLLTSFLDDPSPLVRRALAETFASSREAPHHIVLALADDQSAIAAIVLHRSPILSDAELIDCAMTGDAITQAAIASRPSLSAAVATALAEIAGPEALVALAANMTAPIPTLAIRRMIKLHPDHAPLRQALLNRPNLPAVVRVDLVDAVATALAVFVSERDALSSERTKRLSQDVRDQAIVAIYDRMVSERSDLIAHLRRSGYLTVSFTVRAILSGKVDLFKAVLSELSGVAMARIDALVLRPQRSGFAALCRKAGLPQDLLPAFRIALAAARDADWTMARSAALSSLVIERVLTGCEAINDGTLDKLLVLLRRFESEAARCDARATPMIGQVSEPVLTLEAPILEPLLLQDLDEDAYRLPTMHGRPQRMMTRREPRLLSIDLKAIEDELCAA